MSLGNEEQNALDQFAYANNQSQKTMKKYTREFLLSFSELDVCKKLPAAGFDRSILSEFEDASQDRQNTAGNFSSYSFKRHEYGSSPPTRGVVGPVGRWDNRSSGRSDRDSDSQSDRESDSGKRCGNESRRPMPVPEHDGLLGSGSFPRSSGSAVAYAPKFRANGQYQLSKSNEPYQLSKSNEPYHPPRPYKAIPHSRKAANDSYNDETFGSSDYTGEDRAEEEKKRRASFEMWRKEQREASQENQIKPDKSNPEFDFTELMNDSKNEISLTHTRKESDDILLNLSDSTRANNPPHSPAFRPPVPPGFGSAVSESNLGPRASSQPKSLQVKNSEFEDFSNSNRNLFISGTPEIAKGELPAENIGWSEKQQGNVIDLSVKGNNVIAGLGSSKLTSEIAGLDPSSSIIDRLFGGALTLNGDHPSHHSEQQVGEVDEMWASDTVRSSKFAHLFFEEEKKQVNDPSSGGPNGLLSLIQGGGMDGSHVSAALTSSTIPQIVLSHSTQHVDGYILPNLTSSKSELPEQLGNPKNVHKPAEVSAVLTCEDLEKSILSENGENHSVSSVQGWNIPEVKEQQKVPVDNDASHHLLSLLQKADTLDVAPSGNQLPKPSENIDGFRRLNFGPELNDSEMNAKGFPSSGKTLTLESLFGSAFMKELQSVGGSGSIQRNAEGSEGLYLLDPNAASDSTNVAVRSSFVGPTRNPYGPNVPLFMEGDNVKSDNHLTHLGGKETIENLSHFQADKGPSFGEYGRSNVRLPEEDSLIASHPLNFQNLLSARNSLKDELLTSAETKMSIKGKVASLDSGYRDERPLPGSQEYPSFLHSHFDKIEPEFPSRGHNVQPPSQGLNRSQFNHGPLFHQSDPRQANVNSSMNFMRPDGSIPLESPQNNQFPMNMLRPPFPHGSSGPSGFDPPLHNPAMQQMHAPGNFAPSNLQRGFSWSGSPLHATNQLPGFSQDMNQVHGFHPLRGHPSHNSVGISPGPDAGHRGSHPEALQRLIDMELGSKSRQMSPFSPAAQNQGMYGHELDMGFRYR